MVEKLGGVLLHLLLLPPPTTTQKGENDKVLKTGEIFEDHLYGYVVIFHKIHTNEFFGKCILSREYFLASRKVNWTLWVYDRSGLEPTTKSQISLVQGVCLGLDLWWIVACKSLLLPVSWSQDYLR